MSAFALENTVSPFNEMLAYEMLWSKRQSLAKIAELFAHINLPSEALHSLEGLAPDEELLNEIRNYLVHKSGFSVSVSGTYQYPEGLEKHQTPFKLMYYRGNLGLVEHQSVSVVGTRKVSEQGVLRAKKLVQALIEQYTIVSGLAAGVDTVALQEAIRLKGNVIGVIGTPIDQYYPRENQALQEEIATKHLLLSHVPFFRYEKEHFLNHKYHFPERNEIMAAISKATIIVEASDTSGTLTQARACLRYGHKLIILNSCFEVPGLKWPHKYLEQGAIRVRNEDEVLNALEG